METYITICKIDSQFCCMTQVTQIGAQYQPRGVEWGENGREVQERRDVFIPNYCPDFPQHKFQFSQTNICESVLSARSYRDRNLYWTCFLP